MINGRLLGGAAMEKPARVLIVEDNLALAGMIAINLMVNGFQPAGAIDADSAQSEVDAELPDVALLSATLGGGAPISLVDRWRTSSQTGTLPIVLLASHEDECVPFREMQNCSKRHLIKPVASVELIASLHSVVRVRSGRQRQARIQIGDLTIDPPAHRVSYAGQDVMVRATEFKVLHFLMKNAEVVYSRTQLVENIWGQHSDIGPRTVDVHIKRLREVLGGGSAMIETVRHVGYRLSVEPLLAANPTLA